MPGPDQRGERAGSEQRCVRQGAAGAGPASLVGLGIARDRGWSAPPSDTSGATGTEPDKVAAVEQADTARAESETKADTETGENR